jgi:HEAT repeat protein
MSQDFSKRNLQNSSSINQNPSVTDFSTGEGLVCTDADQEELNKFYDEIKKFQDKLDEPTFVFENVVNPSVVDAWRKALVACNYSLEDVPTLLADLNSNDENTSTVAYDVLLEMGSLATPALIAAFRDNDENVRFQAKNFIVKEIGLNSKYLPVLAEALEDNNANVRHLAISALNGTLDSTFANDEMSIVVHPLIEALKDKDENIRSLAADTLWKIGEKAIPALTEASHSEDESIRQQIVNILRRIDREPRIITLPAKVRFWINAVWKHFANQRG